jgi:hypothetical protein
VCGAVRVCGCAAGSGWGREVGWGEAGSGKGRGGHAAAGGRREAASLLPIYRAATSPHGGFAFTAAQPGDGTGPRRRRCPGRLGSLAAHTRTNESAYSDASCYLGSLSLIVLVNYLSIF